MENYGSKIKKYRVNNGLTQNDLANLLHVTPQAVSKWENNQSEPDLATFRKLSEVLDVSIDDFFGNEKIMTNNQDLGICSVCHKPYGSNGLREIDNEIVCVDCLRKRELKIKQEEGKVLAKEKEKEKIRLDRKNLSIRLIIGLIIGTIITAFFVVSILTTELKPDESFAELVITAIVMGLMSLTFITQMLHDSWLRNTFSNYVGKSFRMPGVIFNLSISGVIWLILVKLLFKLIGFILSVIVFIFCLIITFLISPITYVIDLILYEEKRYVMKKILGIITLLILSFTLISCDKTDVPKPNIPPTNEENDKGENEGTDQDENTTLKDINVTMSNLTVTYDGLEYEILINGVLPEGVSVTYTNNKQTNAGTYNVKASLKGEGYNDKELTATLTINKKTFSNQISLNSKTVTYNNEDHYILIDGNLPENTTVKYYYNEVELSSVKNAGTYDVVALISLANYEDLRLTSTLVIEKALISTQFTFNSKIIEYDSNNHSLELIGNIPSGSTITYLYNNEQLNSVSEVGVYEVTAIISSSNYIEKRLEATLTIKSTEEQLYSIRLNNKIYFKII